MTANYVPFHFDIIGLGANVDVELGCCGGKVGGWGEMGLLMLLFYCMIGRAAIDIFAIDTNAHIFNALTKFSRSRSVCLSRRVGRGGLDGMGLGLLVFAALTKSSRRVGRGGR